MTDQGKALIDAKVIPNCLKEIANIGSTTYQNVCDGTSVVVPWGTLNWVGMTVVATIGLIFLGIFAVVALQDIRRARY